MADGLNGKYFGSKDGEMYQAGPCDTVEECVKETIVSYDCKVGDTIHIGVISQFEPHVDIDSIFDDLSCQAIDECGEIAEDWLYFVSDDIKRELEKEVNTVIKNFLIMNDMWPNFGRIDDTFERKVTQKDCK